MTQGKTIILPFASLSSYLAILYDRKALRKQILRLFQEHPELFPEEFEPSFQFCGFVYSKKLDLDIRRIRLPNANQDYQIRPSCVMPYMTATTDLVEKALFLRRWGVPFWALTYCFGFYDMFWYRLFISLGQNSLVGTTIKTEQALPTHLTVDEKHHRHNARKSYIATTAANGCLLGAVLCETASKNSLTEGYGEFAKELRILDLTFTPETVNCDGWSATQEAMKSLFPGITVILCFLHPWLKIRQGFKREKDLIRLTGERVWEAYRAENKRSFSQRIRRLRSWVMGYIKDTRLGKNVIKLCNKKDDFAVAYEHEGGRRTSNEVDRLMDVQDRQLYAMREFAGKQEEAGLYLRAMCLLHNFRPLAEGLQNEEKPKSMFEKANGGLSYHENWLQKFNRAASLQRTYPSHKNRYHQACLCFFVEKRAIGLPGATV
jgi:hypothetical protein